MNEDRGVPIRALLIRRHGFALFAADRASFLQLFYSFDLPADETEALAALPLNDWNRLLSVLLRESNQGRTAGHLVFESEPPSRGLLRLLVEQRLVLMPEEDLARQRIADALQEISGVSIRVGALLGKAIRNALEPSGGRKPGFHEKMYG